MIKKNTFYPFLYYLYFDNVIQEFNMHKKSYNFVLKFTCTFVLNLYKKFLCITIERTVNIC